MRLEQLNIDHEYIEIKNVAHNYPLIYDGMGDHAFGFYTKAFANISKSKENKQ